MPQPSRIQKHHYLIVKFFGVADNPTNDVNPYDSVGVFRRSTISSLRWGATPEVVAANKDRVARNLHEAVKLDDMTLARDDIRSGLDRNETLIDTVVFTWAGKARVND
ncbi:MAG: hypothetical protein MJE66_13330 [Proteobacteria bacterium]|nr:hypothetical protein [Pseudomonadota bacterium]